MVINVNGKQTQIQTGLPLLDLLKERDLDSERVVVERNREIVTREMVGSVILKEGDSLEILCFVGGG